MKTDSLNFSFDLANSIHAAAPERKTQMRRVALHILRGGMFTAPHGEEAPPGPREVRPDDRLRAVSNHEARGPSFETRPKGRSSG
ncbi:MAG TPA: hypothetical protein VIR82_12130 [Bradyrhizobium sp.]